jgi:hypothetical protein
LDGKLTGGDDDGDAAIWGWVEDARIAHDGSAEDGDRNYDAVKNCGVVLR